LPATSTDIQGALMGLAVIRADASANIGGGHIYRCLTLADQLCELEIAIHFICREENGHLAELIRQRGYRVSLLSAEHDIDEIEDARQCRSLMEKIIVEFGTVSTILVDHYRLSAIWHTMIAPLAQHMTVIDDLANRPYRCDLIFDQSLGRTLKDYEPWVTEQCKTIVTGAEHALLRYQFINLREAAKIRRAKTKAVKTVLVAMGATDPDNVTIAVLQQLTTLPEAKNWSVKIALTDKAKHIEEIKRFIDSSALSIELLINVYDMADLILRCDIAIAAAGTSMLERCCLGLPNVIVCVADNQQHIADALVETDSAIAVMSTEQLPTQLSSALQGFVGDMNRYQTIANNTFAVCNGDGKIELGNQIDELMQIEQQWLHPVTKDHVDLLFQWQQSPQTRQYSRDSNPPTLDQHQQWFAAATADLTVHFYIIMLGQRQCGFVRLNPTKHNDIDGFEVSIAMAPDAHGLGMGHKALVLLHQLHPEKHLFAYIDPQNKVSIRAFGKADFSALSDDWYVLEGNCSPLGEKQ
jgi:UDP-2,4-diacetamido-2,4,6-trideoxy-beta-L-altropyranose hydrolase